MSMRYQMFDIEKTRGLDESERLAWQVASEELNDMFDRKNIDLCVKWPAYNDCAVVFAPKFGQTWSDHLNYCRTMLKAIWCLILPKHMARRYLGI